MDLEVCQHQGGAIKMKKLFTFLLLGLFLISFVSAWEWDNVYSYDEKTKEATIENALGLGSDLAVLELTWGDTVVPRGTDVHVGTFNLTLLTENTTDLFDSLDLISLKNEKTMTRGKQYKVKIYKNISVDDYNTTCEKVWDEKSKNNTEVCTTEEVGSHYEIQSEWLPILNPNFNFEVGVEYEIGVFVDVEKNDYGDWIPSLMGVKLKEWATWTEDLYTDLYSYYKLDESSGDAIDSYNSKNGTVVGATQNVSGKINTAYDFDGTGDYVYRTSSGLPSGASTRTVSAWINYDATTSDDYYFTYGDYSTGAFFGLGIGGGGDADGLMFMGYGADWNSIATLNTDTWYNIVFTYNGTDIEVFINNVSQGTNTISLNTVNSKLFSIGARTGDPGNTTGQFFDGTIDEIGIWSRVLTSDEISDLYNSGDGLPYGITGTPPSVVLVSPVDNANLTSANVEFQTTVTDDLNVDNVSLYIDGVLNQTNSSGFNGSYVFNAVVAEGEHNWSILAYNNQSLSNQSETRTFNYTQPPISIDLLSPTDASTSEIPLVNVSCKAYDDNGVTQLNLTINGVVNKTITNTTVAENLTLEQVTNFSEGNYTWGCSALNAITSSTSNNRTFEVLYSSPVVTLIYPEAYANYTNQTFNYTFNITDVNGLSNYTLYVNGAENFTNTSGVEGPQFLERTYDDERYNYSINATSIYGKTTSSATRDFTIHTTTPSSEITAPSVVNYAYDGINLTLEYNFSEPGENLSEHLDTCWYEYIGTDNLDDLSFMSNSSYLALGKYWYYPNGIMYGSSGDQRTRLSLILGDDSYYVLDGGGPFSSFQSGIPDCNDVSYSSRARFSNSTTGYYACARYGSKKYIIKQNNFSELYTSFTAYKYFKEINCTGNSTTFEYSPGVNSIFIFGNDTFGFETNSSQSWNVNFLETNRIYQNNTLETSGETFKILFDIDSSITSSSANLNYYNDTYISSVSSSGLLLNFTNNIDIPSNLSGNIPFNWTINFSNSTGTYSFNTTSSNQTIGDINITICGVNDSAQLIFETYSATNSSQVLNATFQSSWEIKDASGDSVVTSENYEDLTEENSSWYFCISPNSTGYTVSADILVDATNYTQTSHYIVNADYNGTGTAVPIYLIADDEATLTELIIKDLDNSPVGGVYTTVQRYDVGTDTYYNVAMARSDSSGSDLLYLDWYDTWYRFIGSKSGSIVFSVGPEKISDTPKIIKYGDVGGSDYEKFRDVEYSLTFNEDTDNFILSFTDTSGLISSSCLRVIKRNATKDYSICDICETSNSATLYCNIAGWGNGTFIADYYATGSPRNYIKTIVELVNVQAEIYDLIGNDNGTGMAFLIAGVICALFLVTPALGILGAILGMVLAVALGFQPFDYVSLIGISIIGVLIMWAVQR